MLLRDLGPKLVLSHCCNEELASEGQRVWGAEETRSSFGIGQQRSRGRGESLMVSHIVQGEVQPNYTAMAAPHTSEELESSDL